MFTIAVVIGNSFSPSNILGAVWLQAIVPYCQLEIVVSLTLDKGESLASKFLRNKILQNLGKIGMTIYCLVCGHIHSLFSSKFTLTLIAYLALSNNLLPLLFVESLPESYLASYH